jgi:signal transduction histidine kinase
MVSTMWPTTLNEWIDLDNIIAREMIGAQKKEINAARNIGAPIQAAIEVIEDHHLPIETLLNEPGVKEILNASPNYYPRNPLSAIKVLALDGLTDRAWSDYNDEKKFCGWGRELLVFKRLREMFDIMGFEENALESIGKSVVLKRKLETVDEIGRLLPTGALYLTSASLAAKFNNVTRWTVEGGVSGTLRNTILNRAQAEIRISYVEGYNPLFDSDGESYSRGVLKALPMLKGLPEAKLNQIKNATSSKDSDVTEAYSQFQVEWEKVQTNGRKLGVSLGTSITGLVSGTWWYVTGDINMSTLTEPIIYTTLGGILGGLIGERRDTAATTEGIIRQASLSSNALRRELESKEEAATSRADALQADVARMKAQAQADAAHREFDAQTAQVTSKFGASVAYGHHIKGLGLKLLSRNQNFLAKILQQHAEYTTPIRVLEDNGVIINEGLEHLCTSQEVPVILRNTALTIRDSNNDIDEMIEYAVGIMKGGSLELKKEKIDLEDMLKTINTRAQAHYNTEIETKGIREVYITGDARQLAAAFANIINNAAEASSGGYVEISVNQLIHPQRTLTLFDITQSGYLPKEKANELNSERKVATTKIDGSGEGAYASRMIFKSHKGTIRYVASQHENDPARIQIKL